MVIRPRQRVNNCAPAAASLIPLGLAGRGQYHRRPRGDPSHNVAPGMTDMNRILLAAGMLALAHAAAAQEVTLKAITAFAEGTTYSRPFERFIARVNQDGKGLVQINYIGGPKAMPPFEVGNALKGGVVDVANSTGAFYTNVMPESDAWKLTERPMSELPRNGGHDSTAGIYAAKMHT